MKKKDYWDDSTRTMSSASDSVKCSNLIEIAKQKGRLSKSQEKIIFDFSITNNKSSFLIEYAYAMNSKLPEEMHNFVIMNSNEVSLSYFKLLNKIKHNLENLASVFDENMTLKEIIEKI